MGTPQGTRPIVIGHDPDPVSFWLQDPFALATESSTSNGSLNFLTISAIVACVSWSIYSQDLRPIRILLVLLVVSCVIYLLINPSDATALKVANPLEDPLSRTHCRPPTSANPFSNRSLFDFFDPDVLPACRGPEVDIEAQRLLEAQSPLIYNNRYDLYSRDGSRLTFVQVPDPSLRDFYLNWLYKPPSENSCKTSGYCPPLDDIRLHRVLDLTRQQRQRLGAAFDRGKN